MPTIDSIRKRNISLACRLLARNNYKRKASIRYSLNADSAISDRAMYRRLERCRSNIEKTKTPNRFDIDALSKIVGHERFGSTSRRIDINRLDIYALVWDVEDVFLDISYHGHEFKLELGGFTAALIFTDWTVNGPIWKLMVKPYNDNHLSRSGACHPHASHGHNWGSYCTGTAMAIELSRLINSGYVDSAIIVATNCIRSFNASDTWASPTGWIPSVCPICDSETEELRECVSCNTNICEECSYGCDHCGETVCGDCLRHNGDDILCVGCSESSVGTCNDCGRLLFESDESCIVEDEVYCNDCFHNLEITECFHCGEYRFLDDISTDSHDRPICQHCIDRLNLVSCVECGNYFGPDDLNDDGLCENCIPELVENE